MIRLKSWFFQSTKTALKDGVRFKNGDKPTEDTFKDLTDSSIFKSEANDRAKEDVGTFSQDSNGHVTLATDVQAKSNTDQKPDRSLVAQPHQLPIVTNSSLVTINSGDDIYSDSVLGLEIDGSDLKKNNFILSIKSEFSNFLNTVFAKIELNISLLSTLQNLYNSLAVSVSQNSQAINDLSSGTALSTTPVGTMSDFFGAAAPNGWVLLRGNVELDKTTYSDLYAIVGDIPGYSVPSGDPNKFLVWVSEWDNRVVGAANSTNDRFFNKGVETEFISRNHLPEHYHDLDSNAVVINDTMSPLKVNYRVENIGGFPLLEVKTNEFRTQMAKDGKESGFPVTDVYNHSHSLSGRTGVIENKTSTDKLSKLQPTVYMNKILFTGVFS